MMIFLHPKRLIFFSIAILMWPLAGASQTMTAAQRQQIAQTAGQAQQTNYAYVEPAFLQDTTQITAAPPIFKEEEIPAKEAEAQTNAQTAFSLGYMYNFGKVVRVDDQKALEFYQMAASRNLPEAMVTLGRLFKTGGQRRSVPVDFAQSIYWFRKAAESGSGDGWFELGQMFEAGAGVAQNDPYTIVCYTKAAELNNFPAHVKLGIFAQYGRGQAQNLRKAIEHFNTAITLTPDKEIQDQIRESLGNIYSDIATVQTDAEKILQWRKLAASHLHTYSQVVLGDMYSEGKGVDQDVQQAVAWYTMAAEQKQDAYSMSRLGYLFSNGLGNVQRDYGKAFRWYKEAAENGNAEAAWQLGNMYHSGLGVAKDPKEAEKWFTRSKNASGQR